MICSQNRYSYRAGFNTFPRTIRGNSGYTANLSPTFFCLHFNATKKDLMRRSQAPSIRKQAKLGVAVSDLIATKDVSTHQEMQWGTIGGFKGYRPQKYHDDDSPLKEKRIFLVLWRKQSNKKHKTWTGNGTLELTESKVTLKDETGKVLDFLTCFKKEKIHENALLEIGTRDVEIQMELRTTEECIAQRKEEIENWYCQQEESVGKLSESNVTLSKRLGAMNMLKKRKRSPENEYYKEPPSSNVLRESGPPIKVYDYICMLYPAELQIRTMELLASHCQDVEVQQNPSGDLFEIAEHICDHPILLKHLENEPLVKKALLPHMPAWQDMGLYESAKFECVHLMLDELVFRSQKCAIVAQSQKCLNIIKGYCEYWDIPHIQIEDSLQASYFNEADTNDAKTPMVALATSSNLPQFRLSDCKYVILYNFCARKALRYLVTADTRIYTLITSSSWEERQFQQHLGMRTACDSFTDILNLRVQSTHQLLEVQSNKLSSWKEYIFPYPSEFFEDTFFGVNLSNLRYVYSKERENIFEEF